MEFRIGVNLGDVMVEGDQIYGDGVNVAARLESLADPGGICISGTVHEQIQDKLPLGYQDSGEQTVKNIARPVRVWRVLLDGSASPPQRRPFPAPGDTRKASRLVFRVSQCAARIAQRKILRARSSAFSAQLPSSAAPALHPRLREPRAQNACDQGLMWH